MSVQQPEPDVMQVQSPFAAFALGFQALQGRGRQQSLRDAYAYFARAAGLGHADASAIQRNFLAMGVGTPRDWPAALSLLQAAADKGDAGAQVQLALITQMKLTGAGDPADSYAPERIGTDPDIWRFPQFFSEAECRYLMEFARPAFQPAAVGHLGGGNAQQIVRQIRTCAVAAIPWVAENLIVHALNRRIARASETNAEQGEPLQILRYSPGEEFKPHTDATEDRDNQRILTVLVYLNEDYSGGETLFAKSGFKLHARTGEAILFRNASDDGTPDPATIHAGLPVVSGQKFVASRWIRQKRFGPAA